MLADDVVRAHMRKHAKLRDDETYDPDLHYMIGAAAFGMLMHDEESSNEKED